MRKYFFLLACGFFIAALTVQFQYDFATEDFRQEKLREFRLSNWFQNMPPGGYTRKDILKDSEETILELSAEIQGQIPIRTEDMQYQQWVIEQREKNRPTVMFLYGAALLFTFGGMIVKVKI